MQTLENKEAESNISIEKKQQKAIKYYNRFSRYYDLISSDRYYRAPRECAIREMNIVPGSILLNLPCGTGQNFHYFQEQLNSTGKIIGVDLSEGMLAKASVKVAAEKWRNIQLFEADARSINREWVNNNLKENLKFDAILCDLGLSGFPDWKKIIDQLLTLLKPGGRLVIMDWFIDKPSLRGAFIKWIGKGEVDRPIFQYLETKCIEYRLHNQFKNGQMFVAVGQK